jgi:hypothetical protein
MGNHPTSFVIEKPADWKSAIVRSLARDGRSRYSFARAVAEAEIVSLHSAETLLSDGTRAAREPGFATALQMAKLAGFDLVMVRRKNPATIP